MDAATFRDLADASTFGLPLQALWADAQGDWDGAHALAQQAGSREGDWVHAYLHRKEGDLGNAGYWYARAGKPPQDAGVSLATEWGAIVTALLPDD